MSKKSKVDKFQLVTDKIYSLLQQGVKPWEKPWHEQGSFSNLITGHIYQGINPILCSVDCLVNDYSQPYFLTFNQAQEKGWSIQKGSKATYLFWGGTVSTEDEETGEKRYFSTSKWFPLFNLDCVDDSQCDRKVSDYLSEEFPQNQDPKIGELETFVSAQKANIETSVGNLPCYIRSHDLIQMPPYEHFKSSEGYYSTLLHELCHWTGGDQRLNRKASGKFASSDYAFEELIAELGSAMTATHLKLEVNLDDHVSYIDSWLKGLQNDPKYFFKAAKEARNASQLLLQNAGIKVEE